MSPERDENGDGANEMHYPSPGTEAIDPGPFYHGRDDQQPEHMEGQQPGQDQQQQHHHDDGSADVHGLAEDAQLKQDDATAELQHHHQQQPDPSTPQQQQNARPANIEELQLAAQLGQGLAGTPMMPAAEANMSVEDASLRNIMPHPEPDNGQHGHQHQHQQTPTYNMHDTSASDSIMAHGLQQVAHQLAPHYNMASSGGSDGGIPPRKRSKVSRACDECRRKKIKCDAQTDTGDAPCSSCARSNIRCLFSRIPQKRGPSKGYIKELADRIHSIENKLDSEGGLTQEDLSGLFGDRPRHSSANNIGGGPGDDLSRKRPYSSISGGADLESPISSRHTPWAPDGRPLQSQGDQPSTPFDSSSLAPQPVAPPRLDDANKTPVAPVDTSMDDLEEVTSVDEGVLQDYLSTLQVLYPILPSSQARLETLLATCEPSVRTAFANALLAVAQSSSGNVKLANFLLSSWESGDAPPSQATNIVHAQALLLLLIDADWRGSSTLPALLGRAVSLASTMKLWRYAAPQPGSDPDSDDNLGMRIWWSLVLMDRWHAVGTGSPVMIPDTSVVMPPGLDSVLGETCARLLRFSKVQSRISQLVVSLPPGTTTGDPLVTRMLSDYVEDQRETLPAHIQPDTHPLVFLAYWHCRILATLLRDYHWAELMGPTRELVALLSANADMRNPLANHFGFLVAMALSRLARHGVDDDRNPALSSDANPPAPRAEAVQLMRDVLDRPGSVWDAIRDRLADQQAAATSSGGRPDTAESGVDAASLQRLADLATGHNHDIAPPHDQTAEDADAAEPLSLVQGYLAIS